MIRTINTAYQTQLNEIVFSFLEDQNQLVDKHTFLHHANEYLTI